MPEGILEIGKRAFADSGLKEINLPDSLVTIADDAFSGKEEVVLEEHTVEEEPDLTADNAFAEGLEVPKEEPSQTVEEPIVEEEPDLTADDASFIAEPTKPNTTQRSKDNNIRI